MRRKTILEVYTSTCWISRQSVLNAGYVKNVCTLLLTVEEGVWTNSKTRRALT